MGLVAVLESIAVGLLVFWLPGYAVSRATFPEWRVLRPWDPIRLLETIAFSFVLSVGLTVLVGFGLLTASPTGFQAYWTDPVLEAVLAAVTAGAGLVAWWRGAFSRSPPPVAAPSEPESPSDAWALMVELDRLQREERRLEHRRRRLPAQSPEGEQVEAELVRLREARTDLERHREAEYAR